MLNEQLLNTKKETLNCPMPRGCVDESKQGITLLYFLRNYCKLSDNLSYRMEMKLQCFMVND